MEILCLCPGVGVPVLGRKGASVHVRELVAAFTRAGHNVVLAAQALNKSPWEKPAELEGALLHVGTPSHITNAAVALREFNALLGAENSLPGEVRRILYNRELTEDLKRRFDSDPPDFIYERASLYGTAGVVVARELNVPILLELNAPLAVEQASYRRTGLGELAAQAERWTLARANAVLVVSAALRDHVVGLGVEAGRVHVCPNGVDPKLFQPGCPEPALRARLGLNGGPVLGFVGGLRPWHGVEVLPELVESLAKNHPALQLVIAGDGPLRRELEQALEQRGLRSRVLITGLLPHEEVSGLIRQ